METIKLTISDETLRDGEQQVGLCFAQETKRTLAHHIAQTGVQSIALMPAIHPIEAQLVKTLLAEGLVHQIAASTLMSTAAIQQSHALGVTQIILFHAVSDRLLLLRDPEIAALAGPEGWLEGEGSPDWIETARRNLIQKVRSHLEQAAQMGFRLSFAAEDASRADRDFLVECLHTFTPYLDQFLLCDTVGCLTPDKTASWIRALLEAVPNAPLMVHFHNDMGLALENTIQAILAGATGVSGTFGGIGERAGNAALEQVLHGLRLRFGWEVAGINYDAIAQVCQRLHQLGAQAHPPYSAAAQRHEAGIHVHSLMRDRFSYSIFPHQQPEIWFGKHSGVSSVRYLFEHCLRQSLPPEHYEQICFEIKNLAIAHNRSFSTAEIVQWLRHRQAIAGDRGSGSSGRNGLG